MKLLYFVTTFLVGGLLAAPAAVTAQDSVHVGTRVLSKDQVIEMLQPDPADVELKTRGLRFKNPNMEPPKPKSISMNINFGFDSYQLTDDARKQLDPIGQALNADQLKTLSFVLEGHTDAVGTDEYNLVLSQKRAEAVKQYLSSQYSVSPSRLDAIGRGEQMLLNTSDPTDWHNRRVSISTVIR